MKDLNEIIAKLRGLAGKKRNKTEWFAQESGLRDLQVDVHATLKSCARLLEELPLSCTFMADDESRALLERDVFEWLKIYWRETLERARLVIVISILRTQKWLEGIFLGVHYENLFVFAASYRGLLEAVADSLHAIKFANEKLNQNKKNISNILNDKIQTIRDVDEFKEYLEGVRQV